MKWFVLAASGLVGAALVALAQPPLDLTRRSRADDNALVFAPDGPMLRAASLDQAEPVSDLLWMRSVLVFGERWRVDPDPTWITWLRNSVLAVVELDPKWRSPYFYGGSLLRVLGDIDGSDQIFSRGADEVPDDGYFAFSFAMNAYLYREDSVTAASWMERAASAPQAVRWYAAAAAAMRTKGGDRDGAIAYLVAERATAGSEPERADIDTQLGRLYHDRLVDGFMPFCRAYAEAKGGPPPSPEAFFGWVQRPLPENPRGDAWIVGRDGCVRSAGAEEARWRRLRRSEAAYLK